ncbi:diphosphomevalonate decarboxylase [Nilaparvata lugens]|uniref:diphosphomevalonate decarboxylase n=1 Tax=Nilaparvata lugens TaxID=108931 RepID=UPI00193D5369|nr:diphosphomevalonate decarboxylase [Nilaparvata lugens]
MKIITCIAPVNIATIKYWGKRDTELILPLNDSISVTLSTDQMHSKTTVAIDPDFKNDRMWLNGKEQSVDNPRFAQCLKEIRRRVQDKHGDIADWKYHICSENNFPTAAGLASSAAGYACLGFAQAISDRDFATFGAVTMQDSNQFHAVCLDTYPPIVYMNETSHAIVDFVHKYNQMANQVKLAYTFDAGPNACLFLLEQDVDDVIAHLRHLFPPTENSAANYVRGIPVFEQVQLHKDIQPVGTPHEKGQLKYIIHTKVGDGPQVLNDENEHLLMPDGLPKCFI